ncbi:MAG: AMP-binding protein, partial [Prevotella sp.]|nr:AMP-binding protein [Prevotella sp.]
MTLKEFIDEWNNDEPTVLVHTSGSTGKPKPLRVEKLRMAASAHITCAFLGLQRGDTALLCMPLDYIAGKMVVVRSLVCGLRLLTVEPCGHPLRGLSEAPVFAAMVPLQVYNSLQVEEERALLMQIKHLIIGGGAVSGEMAAELKHFPNAVWSTYGMTETLSHIALRRLSGEEASDWYEPFEGVDVSLNADGCLVIDAPAVCATTLTTNDIAEIAPDGRHFRIRGRRDNVVCSGGIKL